MDETARKGNHTSMSESSGHLQYVLQPEAQKMLGSFSSLLNVRIAFFSLDGRELFSGLGRSICTYCRLLREDPAQDIACVALDKKMRSKARKESRPVCYTCHGQLTEAVLPVILSGRCIGFLMVGQFRTLDKNSSSEGPTFSTPGLKQGYEQTPGFSENQVDDMLHMLSLMVDYITGHYLVSMKDFDVIQPLIDAMEKNPAQTVSLDDAARQIGRSPSSLSHLFKKLTGKGFRQFQIARKIEEADRLLQTFPQMPVKEIAERLGFQDPLYFSRLYRRHREQSPSAKRATVM
jgi:AraC-like DNA-binding protein/ligand-binding sensor protein